MTTLQKRGALIYQPSPLCYSNLYPFDHCSDMDKFETKLNTASWALHKLASSRAPKWTRPLAYDNPFIDLFLAAPQVVAALTIVPGSVINFNKKKVVTQIITACLVDGDVMFPMWNDRSWVYPDISQKSSTATERMVALQDFVNDITKTLVSGTTNIEQIKSMVLQVIQDIRKEGNVGLPSYNDLKSKVVQLLQRSI